MNRILSKFHLTVLFAVSVIISSSLTAKEYTKTYEEEFVLNSDGEVNIENIYGKVNVATWAKNEVQIKVTITVNTSSDSKAESTFDRIDIAFSGGGDHVIAKTNLDSKKSFWNFLQGWWGEGDFKIDYEVSMPESGSLVLENKYGNVDVEDLGGQVNLEVKYGNFTLDHAGGDLIVELAYGNGVVAKANKATIDLSYGKLRINDVNSVDINSKFSKVTIESANEIISESSYDGYKLGDIGVLVNEGKYDHFSIAKLEELRINTKYTQIDIEELLVNVSAELSYGGITLRQIASTLQSIDIDSKYAGIEFGLEQVPHYKIDVDTKYTSVHLPSGLQINKQIKESSNHYIEGYKGKENNTVIISVDADYGGLKIH